MASQATHARGERGWQVGIWVPPLAWLVDLQASFSSVHAACVSGRRWPFFALTLTTLAVVFACGIASMRQGRGTHPKDEPPAERKRFMSRFGLGLSVLFAALIVVTALPVFIIGPCEVP